MRVTFWVLILQSVEVLKQKLLQATIQLEEANKLKVELLDLLKVVYHERDEFRDELMKVLQKLPTSSNIPEDSVPQILHEPLLLVPNPTKANSSITESNSLSHGSSPVDSLLEGASSPDLSNMNNVVVEKTEFRDPESLLIECLVKGKALPEKGKLLESVMEAGPLLQTLLVAGPLPSWRNPPPLHTKVPPFAIKDFDSSGFDSCVDFKPQISCFNSSGVSCSSASMLNFAPSLNYGSLQNASTMSLNCQVPASKRYRFC